MIDFHEEQVVVGNLTGHTVAGFPIEVVKREGLNFTDKILPESEKEWVQNMNNEAYKIFSKYDDFETRMTIVFSHDLQAKTPNGREITLHHRLVPYLLDENGNLWLALCTISAVPLTHKATKACIDCGETGERYDYIGGKFVLSQHKHLTEEEVAILGHLADGIAIKQISAKVGMSLRAVERKKKDALSKLGAHTQAAAVYRAKNMGLI
jgi:DNA-binding CsgD family transcriptional regulator